MNHRGIHHPDLCAAPQLKTCCKNWEGRRSMITPKLALPPYPTNAVTTWIAPVQPAGNRGEKFVATNRRLCGTLARYFSLNSGSQVWRPNYVADEASFEAKTSGENPTRVRNRRRSRRIVVARRRSIRIDERIGYRCAVAECLTAS
jgi:hypothetical protein